MIKTSKGNLSIVFFHNCFIFQEPIEIKKNEILKINIERVNNQQKVWYQWNFIVYNKDMISTKVYPVQNLFGESYAINL